MVTVGRRSAAGGFQASGSAGTWSPERMSLTECSDPSRRGEPDVRDSPTVGVPDLLAELGSRRRHLGADARDRSASATASDAARSRLVAHRDQDAAWAPTGCGEPAIGQQRAPSSRETPSEMPTPGKVTSTVAGQRVVPAAGADRAERLVPDELGLVDRAGVVVEAAGDLQVGDDGTGPPRVRSCRRPPPARRDPRRAAGARLRGRAPGRRREWSVAGDLGQLQARARPPPASAPPRPPAAPTPARGPTLSSLSIARSAASGSVAPAPRKKPSASLRLLTWIIAARDRQGGEDLGHDQRDLDLVVEGQGVASDDVDVGLGELPVATLLWSLPAPHLLDLVAPEREVQLTGVLQHVARERHGEVEVQPELVGLGLPRRPRACSRRRTYTSLSISPLRSSCSSGSTRGSRSRRSRAARRRGGRCPGRAARRSAARQVLREPGERGDLRHGHSPLVGALTDSPTGPGRAAHRGTGSCAAPARRWSRYRARAARGRRRQREHLVAQRRPASAGGSRPAGRCARSTRRRARHRRAGSGWARRRARVSRVRGTRGPGTSPTPACGRERGRRRPRARPASAPHRRPAAATSSGSCHSSRPPNICAGLAAHALHRVGQQLAVGGVDVGGNARASRRPGRPRRCGRGDRGSAGRRPGFSRCSRSRASSPGDDLDARVDDHALLARPRCHHVDVGRRTPRRESRRRARATSSSGGWRRVGRLTDDRRRTAAGTPQPIGHPATIGRAPYLHWCVARSAPAWPAAEGATSGRERFVGGHTAAAQGQGARAARGVPRAAARQGREAPPPAVSSRSGRRRRRRRRSAAGSCGGRRPTTSPLRPRPRPRGLHLRAGRRRPCRRARPADLVLDTDQGPITIALDTEKAPKNSNSLAFLAGEGYFDGTTCHRLTTDGHLRPAVRRPDRHRLGRSRLHHRRREPPQGRQGRLPARAAWPWPSPRGGEAGSQFFLVYQDSHPAARLHDRRPGHQRSRGRRPVAKAGVAPDSPTPGDGPPAEPITITAARVQQETRHERADSAATLEPRSACPGVRAPPARTPPAAPPPRQPWGRVDDAGAVYVRTADGERAGRASGSPATRPTACGSTSASTRRSSVEIDLLEHRLDRRRPRRRMRRWRKIGKLRDQVDRPHCVGDLAAFAPGSTRLVATVDEQRAARKAERAAAREPRRGPSARRWWPRPRSWPRAPSGRHGRPVPGHRRGVADRTARRPRRRAGALEAAEPRAQHLREATPRLVRRSGTAERAEAVAVKEKIVKEAEALASSKDWGPTSAAFRT